MSPGATEKTERSGETPRTGRAKAGPVLTTREAKALGACGVEDAYSEWLRGRMSSTRFLPFAALLLYDKGEWVRPCMAGWCAWMLNRGDRIVDEWGTRRFSSRAYYLADGLIFSRETPEPVPCSRLHITPACDPIEVVSVRALNRLRSRMRRRLPGNVWDALGVLRKRISVNSYALQGFEESRRAFDGEGMVQLV